LRGGAVVTGAGRGIGDAIAERLLADGASVFSLDKIAADEPRAGVVYLQADVTDAASVAEALKAADAQADQIEILVNNPGIQRVGLVGKISIADWSAVVTTHLNGFFLCASEAVPRMAARGKGGAIVSIASTASFVGLPRRGAYCAAKSGILGLVRALSLEVARWAFASMRSRRASSEPNSSIRDWRTGRCRRIRWSRECQ
jgi:NAD(P)-dependent dehydrogenase (short-subunit alcohol dehydrogenase family)